MQETTRPSRRRSTAMMRPADLTGASATHARTRRLARPAAAPAPATVRSRKTATTGRTAAAVPAVSGSRALRRTQIARRPAARPTILCTSNAPHMMSALRVSNILVKTARSMCGTWTITRALLSRRQRQKKSNNSLRRSRSRSRHGRRTKRYHAIRKAALSNNKHTRNFQEWFAVRRKITSTEI